MKRFLLLLCLVGCDEKAAEPTKDPAPTPSFAAPPTIAATPPRAPAAQSELAWQKPAAWREVDHPSSMRKATYAVPKVEGDAEDAEMSVTQVGGGVDANIARWEGQFEDKPKAKIEKKTVDGLEVSIVDLEGTYKGGMGPMMGGDTAPKSDWALLAAVVATEPAHFFKLTGPKKTVEAARPDFDELVGSIAKK